MAYKKRVQEVLQNSNDISKSPTLIEDLHKDVEEIIQQKLPATTPESKILHAEISWNLSTIDYTWDWTKHKITSGLEEQLIQSLEMKVCKKSEAQILLLVGEQSDGLFIRNKIKRYWLQPINGSSTTTATETKCPLEQKADQIYIRTLVSRKMWCEATKELLDERTAIIVQAYRGEKLVATSVVSPKVEPKLPDIKKTLEEKGLTVKFITNNPKIKLPNPNQP